ncbi:hypothetical protein [Staphylococcus schweitzeri]|uniref:hypothetical protein n=1 Tax=Staphylococcus schweitzeri TaxID=1654388 RepID=UPI0005030BB6|nr:hypothetical protein [Staphylococcus schweitzeri]CDR65337.1 phi 11 orf38 [Staphylococcus schweitzeri]
MTIKYTPAQLLYDEIFTLLQGFGIDVIDFKDITEVLPYPFFVVKKFNITKTDYTLQSFHGKLNGMIHVWSKADDFGQHDQCVYFVEQTLSQPIEIEHYQIKLRELTINTIDDNSTDTLLLHTIINIEFEIL